jgi:hypothetical protein
MSRKRTSVPLQRIVRRADLKTVVCALRCAQAWEASIQDAHCHMKNDSEYRRSVRAERRYKSLEEKILTTKNDKEPT